MARLSPVVENESCANSSGGPVDSRIDFDLSLAPLNQDLACKGELEREEWQAAAESFVETVTTRAQKTPCQTAVDSIRAYNTAAAAETGDPLPARAGNGTDPSSTAALDSQEARTKQYALRQLAQRLAPPGCDEAATALGQRLLAKERDSEDKRNGASWLCAVASGGDPSALHLAAAALDQVDEAKAAALHWRQAADAKALHPEVLWQAGQAMLLGQGGAQDLVLGMQSIAAAAAQRHPAAFHALRIVPLGQDAAAPEVAQQYAIELMHELHAMCRDVQWRDTARGDTLTWHAAFAGPGSADEQFRAAEQYDEAANDDNDDVDVTSAYAEQALSFALKASLQQHAGALHWLGSRLRTPQVWQAVSKAAPCDGSVSAVEAFMQRCARAATAAGSQDGDAAYGDLVQQRLAESLLSPDLRAVLAFTLGAAEDGSTHAMVQLARMLEHGIGCKADGAQALMWLSKAAEGGNPVAAFRLDSAKTLAKQTYALGRQLEHGDGCAVQAEVATGFYRTAAEAGSMPAKVALGRALKVGMGCDVDSAGADALWAEVEGSSDGAGLAALAAALDAANPDDEDTVKRAFDLNTKAHGLGDRNASAQLGLMYEQGRGCGENKPHACTLFESAASAGPVWAGYKAGQLAHLHPSLYNRGNVNSRRQSFYSIAANRGHVDSMLAYGLELSRYGTASCFEWYSKAAEAGSAAAQAELGSLLRTGTHCTADPVAAVWWLRKAATAGDTSAKEQLLAISEPGGDELRQAARAALDACVLQKIA